MRGNDESINSIADATRVFVVTLQQFDREFHPINTHCHCGLPAKSIKSNRGKNRKVTSIECVLGVCLSFSLQMQFFLESSRFFVMKSPAIT